MAYRDHPKEHWQSAVEEIEKKSYTKDQAKDLYMRGGLKNGEIFVITGAETKEKKQWVAAVFMNGKMFYAHYSVDDRRLETLKMKAVASLLDIVKRGWVDTRQAPWLPPRVQNINNLDLVLFGATSTDGIDKVLDAGKKKIVIKEKEQIVDEVKDISIDA